MAFPTRAATSNADAFSQLRSTASAAGISLGTLSDVAAVALAAANLLEGDPTIANIPAGDVLAGTFGANKSGGADTGDYTFPAATIFATRTLSTTALATPSAYAATTGSLFASTVSGATIMGFGTTGDVTLKNRAGTDVLVVTANTVNTTLAGALAMTGALSGVTTLGVSGLITSTQDGQQYTRTGASTNAQYVSLANTSGDLTIGVESSAGGALISGSAAYATVFKVLANKSLIFGTNNVIALTIAGTGAATFAAAVTATGALTVNAASQLGTAAGTDVTTIGGTGYGAGVASVRLNGLTTAAVTNQTGTLLNAPVAGNPTFWAPISIAGVVKYFPCW